MPPLTLTEPDAWCFQSQFECNYNWNLGSPWRWSLSRIMSFCVQYE
jgi:hypothetical protein